MKKIIIVSIICVLLLTSCSSSNKNKPIIEDITLNKSTYEDVLNILPNIGAKEYYNEELGYFQYSEKQYANYTINNIEGELCLYFDSENSKLLYAFFEPKNCLKEDGEALKTWLFNKYSDYDQITTDTGFIFSNGNENIEFFFTENSITEFCSIYIEWTVQTK